MSQKRHEFNIGDKQSYADVNVDDIVNWTAIGERGAMWLQSTADI
jgi:hypothetical protein